MDNEARFLHIGFGKTVVEVQPVAGIVPFSRRRGQLLTPVDLAEVSVTVFAYNVIVLRAVEVCDAVSVVIVF